MEQQKISKSQTYRRNSWNLVITGPLNDLEKFFYDVLIHKVRYAQANYITKVEGPQYSLLNIFFYATICVWERLISQWIPQPLQIVTIKRFATQALLQEQIQLQKKNVDSSLLIKLFNPDVLFKKSRPQRKQFVLPDFITNEEIQEQLLNLEEENWTNSVYSQSDQVKINILSSKKFTT